MVHDPVVFRGATWFEIRGRIVWALAWLRWRLVGSVAIAADTPSLNYLADERWR